MLRNRKLIFVLLAGLVLLLAAAPALAVETTITGTVKDTFEIESDDGTVYIIDETDSGYDLVAYAGKIMQVTGDVTEDGDMKIITVTSFKPMD